MISRPQHEPGRLYSEATSPMVTLIQSSLKLKSAGERGKSVERLVWPKTAGGKSSSIHLARVPNELVSGQEGDRTNTARRRPLVTVAAGAFYFTLVFAAGWVLGMLRVFWLKPYLGVTAAVLLE